MIQLSTTTHCQANSASTAQRSARRIICTSALVALAAISPTVHAAEPSLPQASMRPPAALAYETAANIGVISAQLSRNHQQVTAMIAERINAIVAHEREAAQAQARVEDEVDVYRMSRGGAIADSLRALMRTGERAALGPSELDALEATLRSDIATSTALPAMSNDKLDAAAKKLAALAEEPSPLSRAKEVLGFIQATKKAVDKLEADAAAEKQKADDAIKTATTSIIKEQTP